LAFGRGVDERFCAGGLGSISPHDTDKFLDEGESKRSAGSKVDFRRIAACALFFWQIIECLSCPESIASPPVRRLLFYAIVRPGNSTERKI